MRGSTAVMLVVSVALCHALSKDEIEEFTDHLWKTSVLDQNLKDGTNVGNDDDEEVSDHAWEESGKFEGDLILNERQRRLIAEDVAEGLSRNGLKDSTKRWPNNEVIFYVQREHFTGDQVQAIKEGIDDLSRASCIKFRPYRKGDRDAVVIQGSRRGCFSQVGYQGGYQVLNLSGRHPVGRGCFRHGTVVHELLHTLGFYHMQSSHDRDEFINVVWENIVKPARHNFRKYNAFSVSDFGVGYDYDSVLHYSRRAFSSNGGDTLVPKQGGAQIGQRVGLSDKDTQKLNKMYCDADSSSFDAGEQQPSKPITNKKTRNQPFQGHGIGYHQGKTVVIKVPAAETLKLPDSPSYAVFDYFSNAPQALSPAFVPRLGVGKEIAYRSPALILSAKKDELARSIKELSIAKKDKPYIVKDINTKSHAAEEFFKSLVDSKDVDRKPVINKPENTAIRPKDESKVNEDLLEAFERLEKIIKSHPSLKSNVETSDFNTDYSKFLNPERKGYDSKAKKIDELFSQSPKKPERIETKEKLSGDADVLNDKKHPDHTPNVNDTVFVSPLYNKMYGDVDSSFGTSLPNKKPVEETFKLTSKYSVPVDEQEFSHVKSYNDYSSLYNPERKGSEPNDAYTLLGDPVPLEENWYRDNYRPKYDSPANELGRYRDHFNKLQTNRESHTDEMRQNKIKDKDRLSIPYEMKYSSNEDSSSIEYPYKENSAEKMYDKYGHIGKSKARNKDHDSSERHSEYKYLELSKPYVGDHGSHTDFYKYDPLSEEDDYSNEKLENNDSSKAPDVNARKDHASKNKSKNLAHDEENPFTQDKLYDRYSYGDSDKGKHILKPAERAIQAASYRVTEEIDEKDQKGPLDNSKNDEDYSSFERQMDDRLTTILKNYDKIDNFDIKSPYDRHESSESSEHVVKLKDNYHASTTESIRDHENRHVYL